MKPREVMLVGTLLLAGTCVAWAGVKRPPSSPSAPTVQERTGRAVVPDVKIDTPSVSLPADVAAPVSEVPALPASADEMIEVEQTPAPMEPAAVQIAWQSVNIGGVTSTSPSYQADASAGQTAVGEATSDNYAAGVGYWYGAAAAGGCSCPCHGDPQCDGVRSTLQDVVKTVNVAFRGIAASCDASCQASQTDVNCDGVTSVVDVVKEVNVAFRGKEVAAEFCQPCDTPPGVPQECP